MDEGATLLMCLTFYSTSSNISRKSALPILILSILVQTTLRPGLEYREQRLYIKKKNKQPIISGDNNNLLILPTDGIPDDLQTLISDSDATSTTNKEGHHR